MRNLYSMCFLSLLSVGYIHNAKAAPFGVECGLVQTRNARILNGSVAQTGQFPWIASILRNGDHVCGGTIISRRFILSAAHCFNSYDLFKWTITLGEQNLNENETSSAVYEISNVVMHDNYTIRGHLHINDIAIIELKTNIDWTENIQPVCLPPTNVKHSQNAIAAGWGTDIFAFATNNEKLRYVKMDIFENEYCNGIYGNKSLSISLEKSQMCAGVFGQDIVADTTQGDSGGPLLVKLNNREVLVGITSCGTLESNWKGKAPGIYTRVFEYNDWIQAKIDERLYYPPMLGSKD